MVGPIVTADKAVFPGGRLAASRLPSHFPHNFPRSAPTLAGTRRLGTNNPPPGRLVPVLANQGSRRNHRLPPPANLLPDLPLRHKTHRTGRPTLLRRLHPLRVFHLSRRHRRSQGPALAAIRCGRASDSVVLCDQHVQGPGMGAQGPGEGVAAHGRGRGLL